MLGDVLQDLLKGALQFPKYIPYMYSLYIFPGSWLDGLTLVWFMLLALEISRVLGLSVV